MDEPMIVHEAPFQVEREAGKARWWYAGGRSARRASGGAPHGGRTPVPVTTTTGPARRGGGAGTPGRPRRDTTRPSL